jgi:hypothetical protein
MAASVHVYVREAHPVFRMASDRPEPSGGLGIELRIKPSHLAASPGHLIKRIRVFVARSRRKNSVGRTRGRLGMVGSYGISPAALGTNADDRTSAGAA